MTVGELIAALQEFPPDHKVYKRYWDDCCCWNHDGGMETREVEDVTAATEVRTHWGRPARKRRETVHVALLD